tara:strand:- start:84 stop:464 length:381 start_codon:yes stop_codon:yes gene_type:complete
MSRKLKENQLLAARLLSYGLTAKSVAKSINVREETISRWKSEKYFQNIIEKNQYDFLDYIEEKHFQIFIQCLSTIQHALESNNLSIKEKSIICIKYLSSFSNPIIHNYNRKKLSDKETKKFNKIFS